jgi:TRAP-type C4-dicarboxylate transport system substrate-binding protein
MVMPAAGLAAEITLKLGHVAPPGPTTHDVSARKFAERVAANTNGKVEVKVYGNSQFGNLMEHWGQIKAGAIDLFDQDAGAAFMPEPKPKNFIITLFPYVFESQKHFHNFCKSDLFKSMMAKVEKATNVKYLGFAGDRTPRGFTTTNKRVTTPADIKGLKLRVPPVPPFVAAYKAWGANPTPVQAKEIYTSLKSGMVMGMDQDMTMTYAAKYHEIQKYFIAVNYMRSGMGIWINADKWASLPADAQAAMLKAVQETEVYVNKFTAQQMEDARKGLTEAGVEIIHPDLKPWMEMAEKEVLKHDGKTWEKGLYEKVKALK